MTHISPLNFVHKVGKFGDHDKKNENNLLKISEVSKLLIFQIHFDFQQMDLINRSCLSVGWLVCLAYSSGMSVKLWHNCGKPQFGVVFAKKLCGGCGCGVHFPKIVVGVVVVVVKI